MTLQVIEHFCSALRKDGYVLYIPQKVWQAYQGGLLKLQVFYLEKKQEEAQPLPKPTFTSPEDWRAVLNYCHLLGVGGAEKTSARPYRALLRQTNDSVVEVMRISLVFIGPYGGCEYLEARTRLNELWPRRRWGFSVYLTGNLIIQTNLFSKERLAKIRRRVEDRLRKGSPDDVLQIARSFDLI